MRVVWASTSNALPWLPLPNEANLMARAAAFGPRQRDSGKAGPALFEILLQHSEDAGRRL